MFFASNFSRMFSRQISLPVFGVEANNVAGGGFHEQPAVVKSGRRSRAGVSRLPSLADGDLPEDFPVEIDRRDGRVVVDVAAGVDAAAGERHGREPAAEPLGGPKEFRAALGPLLQQPGLRGKVVVFGPAELRPGGEDCRRPCGAAAAAASRKKGDKSAGGTLRAAKAWKVPLGWRRSGCKTVYQRSDRYCDGATRPALLKPQCTVRLPCHSARIRPPTPVGPEGQPRNPPAGRSHQPPDRVGARPPVGLGLADRPDKVQPTPRRIGAKPLDQAVSQQLAGAALGELGVVADLQRMEDPLGRQAVGKGDRPAAAAEDRQGQLVPLGQQPGLAEEEVIDFRRVQDGRPSAPFQPASSTRIASRIGPDVSSGASRSRKSSVTSPRAARRSMRECILRRCSRRPSSLLRRPIAVEFDPARVPGEAAGGRRSRAAQGVAHRLPLRRFQGNAFQPEQRPRERARRLRPAPSPVSTSPIDDESQSRSAAVDQGLPTVHPAGRTPAAGRPTSGRAATQRPASSTAIAWNAASGAKCSIHRAIISARSVGKATLLRHQRSSQRSAWGRSSAIDAM